MEKIAINQSISLPYILSHDDVAAMYECLQRRTLRIWIVLGWIFFFVFVGGVCLFLYSEIASGKSDTYVALMALVLGVFVLLAGRALSPRRRRERIAKLSK